MSNRIRMGRYCFAVGLLLCLMFHVLSAGRADEPMAMELKEPYKTVMTRVADAKTHAAKALEHVLTARSLLADLPTSEQLGKDAKVDDAVVARLAAAATRLRDVPAGDKKGVVELKALLAADKAALEKDGTDVDAAQMAFAAAFQKLGDPQKQADAPAKSAVDAAVVAAHTESKKATDDSGADAAKVPGLVTLLGEKTTKNSLAAALENVHAFGLALVTRQGEALGKTAVVGLLDEKAGQDPDKLQDVLSTRLAEFGQTEKLMRDLHGAWKATAEQLKSAHGAAYTADVDDLVAGQAAQVKKAFAGFTPWFAYLMKHAADLTTALGDLMKTTQPTASGLLLEAKSLELRTKAKVLIRNLDLLNTGWQSFVQPYKAAKLYAEETKNAEVALKPLQEAKDTLSEAGLAIVEFLAGDADKWVEDNIRLFYFTDVPRILKTLNPAADLVNPEALQARQAAQTKRSDLVTREAQLFENLGRVNDLRSRILTIREEIRQTNAAAEDADRQAVRTGRLLTDLQARQTTLNTQSMQAGLTEAQKAAIQAQLAGVNREVTRQQRAKEDADAAKTAADQRRSDLLDEQKGLPADLKQAEKSITDMQAEVRRLRREIALLAVDEAEAFGAARDNSPFWLAPARRVSNDPAHRVVLYGHEDSRTIFIRGTAPDVERVKEIIAAFDVPAPQARLTLWTLQFNGKDNKELARFLSDVDDELRDMRSNVSIIQELLRGAVNDEVNAAAEKVRKSLDPSVTQELEQGKLQRLLRYSFYCPEVRRRLGFDLDLTKPVEGETLRNTEYLTRWTLPDPVGTTTTGELLFVLQLAPYQTRLKVIGNFSARLDKWEKYLSSTQNGRASSDPTAGASGGSPDGFRSPIGQHQAEQALQYLKSRGLHNFPIAILGGFPPETKDGGKIPPTNGEDPESKPQGKKRKSSPAAGNPPQNPPAAPVAGAAAPAVGTRLPDKDDLSPSQLEILLAVVARAQETTTAEVRYLLRRIDQLPKSAQAQSDLATQLREEYLPLVGWLRRALSPNGANKSSGVPATMAGGTSLRVQALTLLRPGSNENSLTQVPPDDLFRMDRYAWEIASLIGQRNALSRATPRVAAADEMIKRIMILAEDDLDRFFTAPALAHVRELSEQHGKAIQFGTVQRESILATNRLVARVDPNANADVELDSSTNFLQATTQLAQLAQRFHQEQRRNSLSAGLAAASGARIAGNSLLGSLGIGGALSILGAMATQPTEPAGDVYSINSGNLFKVTPVFDPSGQALRFKFDFASTVRVQEPDTSTSRLIPRVERHTVNTEVQLSNFELREISRFETNSRVGVPVKRYGGLPLLNQLSIFKDIPLLGYYVKQKGSKSVRQESLILAQTAVYPTIGDVVGLLTTVPTRTDLSRELPAYLDGVAPTFLESRK